MENITQGTLRYYQKNSTHLMSTYEITESLYFRISFSILLVFMLSMSVSGGIFVCYVIKRHRLLKKRIWIYLFILAMSDVATASFTIPVMLLASINESILHVRWVCNLNGFSMTFCFLWSIHTLVAISVDKYITISRPFQSLQRNGNRPVIVFVFILCSIALCLAGAPLIGFSRYTHLKCRKWCVTISQERKEDIILSLCLSLCGYIAPVCVIVYSSVGIYLVVKRQHSARINMRCSGDPDVLTNGQDVLLKTVTFLICAFLLCWTPALFLILLGMAHIPIPLWYSHVVYVFILLQGNINPTIYCFRHALFKVELRKIFFRRAKKTYVSEDSVVENRSRGNGSVSAIWSNLPSPVPLQKMDRNKLGSPVSENIATLPVEGKGCLKRTTTLFCDTFVDSPNPARLKERRKNVCAGVINENFSEE